MKRILKVIGPGISSSGIILGICFNFLDVSKFSQERTFLNFLQDLGVYSFMSVFIGISVMILFRITSYSVDESAIEKGQFVIWFNLFLWLMGFSAFIGTYV